MATTTPSRAILSSVAAAATLAAAPLIAWACAATAAVSARVTAASRETTSSSSVLTKTPSSPPRTSSLDAQEHPLAVNVADLQRYDFAHAKPGAIRDRQGRVMLERAGALDQAACLLAA